MRYYLSVHYSGVKYYEIEAESLEQAKSEAATEFYNTTEDGNIYKIYGDDIESTDKGEVK